MPKVEKMTFSKSYKISYRYNSVNVDYGIEISIQDGDDTQQIKDMGWATVDQELEKQIPRAVEFLVELSGDQ